MVHILKSNCVKEWKSYFIGETVRKLKIEQTKPQNIAINNINNK